MVYKVLFGSLAIVISTGLFVLVYDAAALPPYIAWIVSLTITTWFLYWLDKRLSKAERFVLRVPELILNLLTLAGGFIGAWIGRLAHRHKTNVSEHVGMFVILLMSTFAHGFYLCRFVALNW